MLECLEGCALRFMLGVFVFDLDLVLGEFVEVVLVCERSVIAWGGDFEEVLIWDGVVEVELDGEGFGEVGAIVEGWALVVSFDEDLEFGFLSGAKV